MAERPPIPPRNGEGDHAKHGGGVFATSRKVIERARKERRSGNPAEVMLWRALRTRPGGFKFRRQHPVSHYILDFTCLAARLDIEIDGEAHNRGDRPERDERRDVDLAALGFYTVRIPARAILTDLDSAIRGIVFACESRITPPPSLRDGPPPRSGEVLLDIQP